MLFFKKKNPRYTPLGLVIFAVITGILLPTLSIASRFRISPKLNNFFRLIIGEQSLLEHLLGGLGAIGISTLIAIIIWKIPLTTRGFPKTSRRHPYFQMCRRFIFRAHKQINYCHWMIGVAMLYIAIGIYWETSQAMTRGFMQYNQLALDSAGSMIGCATAWLLTIKTYRNAKRHKKLHFVRWIIVIV